MNQSFLNLLTGFMLVFSLVIVGCDDDDPTPLADPVAGFTFSANELMVSFSNTSTDAVSYSWNFGDGNTSTETSPNHTYANAGTYTVILTATNGDRTDETTQTVAVELNPENVRLKTGFVVIGLTEDGTSSFAQYFEELPTGTIDISQGTAFQSFGPLSVLDGSMFMGRTDGSPGFEKVSVNGNQEFVEDGIISTISGESFVIAARDADFGVFHDRADPNVVNTFNPTTMQVTGSIDMTLTSSVADDPIRYQDFMFRGDNEIFASIRLEAGGNVDGVALGRININAGQVDEVAQFEGLGEMIVFNSGRRFVDENDNLYFWHGGNLGVPTVSGGVLKIPAGATDYDPNYLFNVPEVNNPQLTGSGSFMSSFNYYKDNLGFALINESLDPRILQLIVERGGLQNFSDEDFQQVQFWLFTSPTGAMVQVDLLNQSVTKINGLPALSVFDVSGLNFLNGRPYFSVSNPTVNAFYEFDEATTSVTKLFDVTGARLAAVIDLSETIQ